MVNLIVGRHPGCIRSGQPRRRGCGSRMAAIGRAGQDGLRSGLHIAGERGIRNAGRCSRAGDDLAYPPSGTTPGRLLQRLLPQGTGDGRGFRQQVSGPEFCVPVLRTAWRLLSQKRGEAEMRRLLCSFLRRLRRGKCCVHRSRDRRVVSQARVGLVARSAGRRRRMELPRAW